MSHLYDITGLDDCDINTHCLLSSCEIPIPKSSSEILQFQIITICSCSNATSTILRYRLQLLYFHHIFQWLLFCKKKNTHTWYDTMNRFFKDNRVTHLYVCSMSKSYVTLDILCVHRLKSVFLHQIRIPSLIEQKMFYLLTPPLIMHSCLITEPPHILISHTRIQHTTVILTLFLPYKLFLSQMYHSLRYITKLRYT